MFSSRGLEVDGSGFGIEVSNGLVLRSSVPGCSSWLSGHAGPPRSSRAADLPHLGWPPNLRHRSAIFGHPKGAPKVPQIDFPRFLPLDRPDGCRPEEEGDGGKASQVQTQILFAFCLLNCPGAPYMP